MSIDIRVIPAELDKQLLSDLGSLEFPTIGHFVEGVVEPEIRAMLTPVKIVGRAVTVRITSPDSVLVHKVTEMLEPGDVVVLDTGGDRRHAPVGDTVAFAMQVRGALGVVIDGVCTDIQGIRDIQFPVFARGTSPVTTKLHGLNSGGINIPISCGGVAVNPGDVVMADDNGVIIVAPDVARRVIDRARISENRHEATIQYLRDGGSLPERSIANQLLAKLLKEESS
jgi:regulator of RNase E activity RraA